MFSAIYIIGTKYKKKNIFVLLNQSGSQERIIGGYFATGTQSSQSRLHFFGFVVVPKNHGNIAFKQERSLLCVRLEKNDSLHP